MGTSDWFVVAVDIAEIPRVVFGPATAAQCDNAAEAYWAAAAGPGETVNVVCEHDVLLEYVEEPS